MDDKLVTALSDLERRMGMFLRYLASGVAFVLTLGFLRDDHFHFLEVSPKTGEWSLSPIIAALLSLVAGLAIYSMHRGLPYPGLKWLAVAYIKWRDKLPKTVGQIEYDMDSRRHERKRANPGYADHFGTWAAEVHFLYCAAWAILAAVAFSAVQLGELSTEHGWLMVLAGLFSAGGWRHDVRMNRAEIKDCLDPKSPASQPLP